MCRTRRRSVDDLDVLERAGAAAASGSDHAAGIPPTHVVDLMTTTGAAALGAQWKVSDVKIVEVPAIQGAMPQYKTTYSIEPQAGGSDFDDSKWPNIEPKDLAA